MTFFLLFGLYPVAVYRRESKTKSSINTVLTHMTNPHNQHWSYVCHLCLSHAWTTFQISTLHVPFIFFVHCLKTSILTCRRLWWSTPKQSFSPYDIDIVIVFYTKVFQVQKWITQLLQEDTMWIEMKTTNNFGINIARYAKNIAL